MSSAAPAASNTVWMASIKSDSYDEASWVSIHSSLQRAEAALYNKMAEQLEEYDPDNELIDPTTRRVKKATSTEKVMEAWEHMVRGDSHYDIEQMAVDGNDDVQFVSEKLSVKNDAAAAALRKRDAKLREKDEHEELRKRAVDRCLAGIDQCKKAAGK